MTNTINFVRTGRPEQNHSARQRRYMTSEHARDLEHARTKRARLAAYDARPIVAWDGEGITLDDGTHLYTLLAYMAENDLAYRSIRNDSGLTWNEISDFMWDAKQKFPGHLHVIFGGNYDFNMIIHTVSLECATRLYKTGHARYGDYMLRWRPSKNFGMSFKGSKTGLTIHDVVSFFQRPFVQACDEYLGRDWLNRDEIIRNKAKRGTFTIDDNDDVESYNAAELINLIRLVRELRARLARVNLRPSRFDGPGSVAGELMRREGTTKAMAVSPPAVAQAARFAYAGGRFEPVRFGWFDQAHEYDVQSAYPSGMRNVPNLARGHWAHHDGDETFPASDFTLFHLRTHAKDWNIPGPMFCREDDGTVCFPTDCDNWVWGPEYGAIYEWASFGYGTVEVLESFEYVEDDYTDKPFAFINDIYWQRKELKALGDGAQIALKLAINSLYGKTAQQLGAWYDEKTCEWHVPRFHQLEWAGYTTSSCRATVLRAAIPMMEHVIAFETDALFTDCPMPHLPVSDKLGDFEHVFFDELIYMQSGVYAYRTGESWGVKSRGIDRGFLTVDMLENGLLNNEKVPAPLTRFVMIGSALRNGIDHWTRWETITKHLNPSPSGKRIHDDIGCTTCQRELVKGFARGPHATICPKMGERVSHEFPIEWINPDPLMADLEELRREVGEWD